MEEELQAAAVVRWQWIVVGVEAVELWWSCFGWLVVVKPGSELWLDFCVIDSVCV